MTSTLDAQTAALRSSTESSPTELALELQKALGQKLVVFILDVRAQTFADWAKGQANPRGSNLDNLRHLARIHKMLAAYDDEHTIRAWFIGLNHLLDDMAPAEVFREGDIRSVQTAARKFIEHA